MVASGSKTHLFGLSWFCGIGRHLVALDVALAPKPTLGVRKRTRSCLASSAFVSLTLSRKSDAQFATHGGEVVRRPPQKTARRAASCCCVERWGACPTIRDSICRITSNNPHKSNPAQPAGCCAKLCSGYAVSDGSTSGWISTRCLSATRLLVSRYRLLPDIARTSALPCRTLAGCDSFHRRRRFCFASKP